MKNIYSGRTLGRSETRLAFLLLAPVIFALVACFPAKNNPETSLTLQLKWTHQAQFAGFYAADQKDYYGEQGLRVTMLPGGPDVDPLASVLEGRAQFGIANADSLILARAQGKPVRAIATIYQRNPNVFMTLAETGIDTPADFAGHAIRVNEQTKPTLHALMAKFGNSPDQYSEVNLPSDAEMFLSGEVPIWSVYLIGLGHSIQAAGHDVNFIYPDDYGVHFYADTIFTTDQMIANSPDLVTRFLSASLEGWRYAFDYPDDVSQMIVSYNPEIDPVLEASKIRASLPLFFTGEGPIGHMKPAVWQAMAETLRKENLLAQDVDVANTFTLTFLQAVYDR